MEILFKSLSKIVAMHLKPKGDYLANTTISNY